MKLRIRYFSWLFLLASGYAQIQPGLNIGGGGGCTALAGNSCATAATANIHVGDTIIAAYTTGPTPTINPTISGCGQTWPAVNRFTGTNFVGGIWIIAHAPVAASNCGLTLSTENNFMTFTWHVYSNVLSVGTPNINNTAFSGSTVMTSPQMTATSAGSFIVGLMFITGAGVTPITPGAGAVTRRLQGGGAAQASGMWLGDTTAASVNQQITIGLTANANVTYRPAAIELVPNPAPPTNRIAQASDAMQTVLMNTARDMNYELPTSGLSPTWCTWFMPMNGSHTYQLEPESTTEVNGQTSHMTIPAWQMTRICRDIDGHYWASPPLLAGTGISITPAATGLTISAAGTPSVSGMTYINGGIAAIPGTVSVDPDSCATLLNTAPATGVQQTDVVSWSMQPSGSGWANGRIILRPEASAGSIAWRACNSGATAYTPSARNINWYVARPTQ